MKTILSTHSGPSPAPAIPDVGQATKMAAFTVRLAAIQDIAALRSVEILAAQRFKNLPGNAYFAEITLPAHILLTAQSARQLWIAEAESQMIIGFLSAENLDRDLHISEMSVVPTHGRMGVGSALLDAAMVHARAEGHRRISLTTFSDIPWNAPFYGRQGFRAMSSSDIGTGLAARMEQEKSLGLANRAAMCRDLA